MSEPKPTDTIYIIVCPYKGVLGGFHRNRDVAEKWLEANRGCRECAIEEIQTDPSCCLHTHTRMKKHITQGTISYCVGCRVWVETRWGEFPKVLEGLGPVTFEEEKT